MFYESLYIYIFIIFLFFLLGLLVNIVWWDGSVARAIPCLRKNFSQKL